MKHLFLALLVFWSITSLIGQEMLEPITLQGLLPIPLTSSATANAICEVEGLLFVVDQTQVEIFSRDHKIGQFNHDDLFDSYSIISRYEDVLLITDSSNHRVIIIFEDEVGSIDYQQQTAEKLGKLSKLRNAEIKIPINGENYTITEKNTFDSIKKKIESGNTFTVGSNHKLLMRGDRIKGFDQQIWAVVKDEYMSSLKQQQVVLVATQEDGLYRIWINEKAEATQIQKLSIPLEHNREVQYTRSLCYLKQWDAFVVGTIGEKLFLYSYKRAAVFKPIVPSLATDTLKNISKRDHFWALCAVDTTLYLAGSDIGTIDYIDIGGKVLKTFILPSKMQLMAITKDPQNTNLFFVGARARNGDTTAVMYQFYLKQDSVTISKKVPGSNMLAAINCFYTINEDSLLIGTKKGLWLKAKNKYTLLNKSFSVRFISKINDGRIVYGGKNNLFLFYKNDHQQIDLNNLGHTPNIAFVFNLKDDKWLICTKNNGIFITKFSLNSLEVVDHYSDSTGLVSYGKNGGKSPVTTVYGGVYDAKENKAILSTNYGLLVYDHNTGSFEFYKNTATALKAEEFNTLSFLRLNDSTAIFGSLKGLVLVDMGALFQSKQKSDNLPQIWRIETHSSANQFVGINELYKMLATDTMEQVAYDTKLNYYLAFPDYSLLAEPRLQLVQNSDTFNLYANHRYASRDVFRQNYSWFGKKDSLSIGLAGNNSQKEDSNNELTIKSEKGTNWKSVWKIALIAAIILLIAALAATYMVRKKSKKATKALDAKTAAEQKAKKALIDKQTEEQKYKARQKLFSSLGGELQKAKSYPDIQKALTGISKDDMSNILEATKISIYKFNKKSNSLKIAGHNDSNPREDELNLDDAAILKKQFNLNRDYNYPAVFFWNNKHTEKINTYRGIKYMSANDAKKDFYEKFNLKRPGPLLGRLTDSFIFILIGSKENPFGILTIQNEKKNTFKGKEGIEEYINLMTLIGQLAAFSIKGIDDRTKIKLTNALIGMFRKRMESHFIKNLLELPIRELKNKIDREIYKNAIKSASSLSELVRNMYEFSDITTIETEIELVKEYAATYASTFKYSKRVELSVEIISEIEEATKEYYFPSFLIINLIHNCIQYNFDKEDCLIINIESSANVENLIIKVADNGKGFDFEEMKKKSNKRTQEETATYRSSSEIMDQFFIELEESYKEKIRIERSNDKGAFVVLYIPLVICDYLKNNL